MGRACSTYGDRILVGKPEKNLKDPGLDGRLILKWILEK
jgi:hypothetical protein